jgi:type II secretory pathway predicted ATPase ExeA
METTELLKKMHSEHAAWQNRILGFRTELKLLNQDLSGIVSRYIPREVPAKAEHFQNQIILQKDVLDIMRHDFKQYENLLEANIENQGKNDVGAILETHQLHINRLADFEKLFNELKEEFHQFTLKDVQVT